MLETPQLVQSPSQPVAAIRLTVPRHEMQKVFGPAVHEVLDVLKAQGLAPAGPVFAYHHRMSPEAFDFEVGFPVERPVTPAGRVRASELPARRVVRAVYQGPYEGLHRVWGELMGWMAAQGLTPGEDLWEAYVRGPESGGDPSTWRTELNRTVAG